MAIDFPLLTQLIQQDWDRVMGGEDGQLPGKGFLIAYHSSAAAVGRLAEDLLCQVVLERLVATYWPQGRVWLSGMPWAAVNWSRRRPGSAATIW